jgi:hypothetical protein
MDEINHSNNETAIKTLAGCRCPVPKRRDRLALEQNKAEDDNGDSHGDSHYSIEDPGMDPADGHAEKEYADRQLHGDTG